MVFINPHLRRVRPPWMAEVQILLEHKSVIPVRHFRTSCASRHLYIHAHRPCGALLPRMAGSKNIPYIFDTPTFHGGRMQAMQEQLLALALA